MSLANKGTSTNTSQESQGTEAETGCKTDCGTGRRSAHARGPPRQRPSPPRGAGVLRCLALRRAVKIK